MKCFTENMPKLLNIDIIEVLFAWARMTMKPDYGAAHQRDRAAASSSVTIIIMFFQ